MHGLQFGARRAQFLNWVALFAPMHLQRTYVFAHMCMFGNVWNHWNGGDLPFYYFFFIFIKHKWHFLQLQCTSHFYGPRQIWFYGIFFLVKKNKSAQSRLFRRFNGGNVDFNLIVGIIKFSNTMPQFSYVCLTLYNVLIAHSAKQQNFFSISL